MAAMTQQNEGLLPNRAMFSPIAGGEHPGTGSSPRNWHFCLVDLAFLRSKHGAKGTSSDAL